MASDEWRATLEALTARLDVAVRANERVTDAKGQLDDPYERLLAAVALSKAHDAALLRSAALALRRCAVGRRPPRWLPRARVLPGEAAPAWWRERINRSYAGIWRAIPEPGPELRVGPSDSDLVQDVARCAQQLQASQLGFRVRNSFYEAYEPDRQGSSVGTVVPPVRGLSPELSRKANLWRGRGRGMRVQPHRDAEFRQAQHDYHAVWDRSRAYGVAVVALLRDVT